MQEGSKLSRGEIIARYQEDANKLVKYYNWMRKASGEDAANTFSGEGIDKSSMAVPVYDSNLLGFINTAKSTPFMNRNYVYAYSRYNMKSVNDELRAIENCTTQEIDLLGDILSKYVLKGMTISSYWAEGLRSGVFLALITKYMELLEIRRP